MKSVEAVVFDLDGLMFDTEALFHRVSTELLRERGREYTPRIMSAMIGRRPHEAGRALKELTGIEETVDQWLALVRERFAGLLDQTVRPTPGLLDLLERLHGRVPLAVATSSNRAYALDLLERHGVSARFEFVLGAEDVSQGKPHPEIYQTAAQRLGIKPAAMVVLEDSPPGVEAARRAGATVVAVPHEHSPAEGLTHADLIVPSLNSLELIHLLERGLTRRSYPDPHPLGHEAGNV